jgi:hypothetical protein
VALQLVVATRLGLLLHKLTQIALQDSQSRSPPQLMDAT